LYNDMYSVESINLRRDRKTIEERCESINLIIGANNSGKTTLLNDIYEELRVLHAMPPNSKWTCGMNLTTRKSLSKIKKLFPKLFRDQDFHNFDEAAAKLYVKRDKNGQHNLSWNENIIDHLRKAEESNFSFSYRFAERSPQEEHFFRFVTNLTTEYEQSVERLSTKFHTSINDIQYPPINDFIFYLYTNSQVLREVQIHIKGVFGLNIEFDNIIQGLKALRIVNKKFRRHSTSPLASSNAWLHNTEYLDSVGHGIRAYLKLIFSLLNPVNHVLLIDEPELFIHPPQRRALGKFIAYLTAKQKKQLFIATHDAEFIRGILSGQGDVKVFRLSATSSGHTYVTLRTTELVKLIDKQSSNLLNERILNSLFYNGTILCENENDRLFYEEAAAKYCWDRYHDVNFLGLNGKDSVISLYNKLIHIGIKPSVILDIDYLVTGKFPQINNPVLAELAKNVRKDFGKLGYNKSNPAYLELKQKGLKTISDKEYSDLNARVRDLISKFAKERIFIVPVGEFESWTHVSKNDLPNAIRSLNTKPNIPLKSFIRKIIN
jgi:AAA15 family ATPase/GTPase